MFALLDSYFHLDIQPLGPKCYAGFDPGDPKRTPCSGHGTCRPTGPYNITHECTCEPHWEGKNCYNRRPSCLVAEELGEELCQNGATCEDVAGGADGKYACHCTSGWWGDHCEKKLAFIYVSRTWAPLPQYYVRNLHSC